MSNRSGIYLVAIFFAIFLIVVTVIALKRNKVSRKQLKHAAEESETMKAILNNKFKLREHYAITFGDTNTALTVMSTPFDFAAIKSESIFTLKEIQKRLVIEDSDGRRLLNKKDRDIVIDWVTKRINSAIHTDQDLASYDKDSLTVLFDIGEEPELHLDAYLSRITLGIDSKFGQSAEDVETSIKSLLCLSVYWDQLIDDETFAPYPTNVHCIVGILLVIAIKFNEDDEVSSSWWSNVLGMEFEDIQSLETSLCLSDGFEIIPDCQYFLEKARELNMIAISRSDELYSKSLDYML